MTDTENTAFETQDDFYHKETKAVPKPKQGYGIDLDKTIVKDIIASVDEGTSFSVDMSKFESFTTLANDRDMLYKSLDCMVNDSTISAALDLYTADSTETNHEGRVVWAESDDDRVGKFINFLLDSINVDKNINAWVSSLVKYGDLYLKLFRESEMVDPLLDDVSEKEPLKEDVKLKMFSASDKYTHYVEQVSNPAEMFELRKFGKSSAYIKTPVMNATKTINNLYSGSLNYSFKKNDIEIYPPTEFVHACLEDDTTRFPEEVSIFRSDDDYDNDVNALNYKVRRGRSIFAPAFTAWRQLTLLKNSLMMNRVTKSASTKLYEIEVGDSPDEEAKKKLYGFKALIEQKGAYNVGSNISEYTNPGPIENSVFLAKRHGEGAVTVTALGGDADVNAKGIADVDFFNSALYGSLGIPKQFLGFVDDNGGFSGGESLAIISSTYAKKIKKIQAAMVVCLTDMVNLMLLDKGLKTYIGKFTIKMQPPTTKADNDRQDVVDKRINNVRDIMDLVDPIEDPATKLKILKSLLSSIITEPDVISLIQDQIDKIENGEIPTEEPGEDEGPMSLGPRNGGGMPSGAPDEPAFGGEEPPESAETPEEPQENGEETILPTPAELDNEKDFSDIGEQ